VTITVEIPEELAAHLIGEGKEPSRAALEAIALDGYRSDRLSDAEIRRLLRFDTRMEVDAFLKEHGALLLYTEEDLAHDRETAIQTARRARTDHRADSSAPRHTG